MKAKDAHKELEGFTGEDLFKKASELYALEVDQLINTRSQGKKPTVGVVESAVKQVAGWFRRVYPGLAWSDKTTPEDIIRLESSKAYMRNGLIDPKLVDWGKRTRREIMRGTPFPILTAMKPGDLEAVSSMMLAKISQDAKKWLEVHRRRKEFAEKYGLTICLLSAEKCHCEHQTTYVLDKDKSLPTSTDDLVFICALDKCIELEKGGEHNGRTKSS